MDKAIIKNNIPYCSKCEDVILNGRSIDCDIVSKQSEEGEQNYLIYIKRCKVCNTESMYYVDMEFENRMIFEDNEVKLVR